MFLTVCVPCSFYFGQVGVGTPLQSFNVILDTGSSDFWLVDNKCTDTQCDGTALFNPEASSTYKASDTAFQITYGTGAVRGSLSADTVSLAGYTVDSQTFAVAEQLASQSLQAPTSGIMGMGFESLAQSRATPFWEVIIEQGTTQDKVFTFQLARNVETAQSNTQISAGGVFTLGYLDPNQYDGDVAYVDLTGQEGYWTIPLDAISVNGQSQSLSSDNVAAIDTGTTLIIAPPSLASEIYGQIPNAQPISSGSSLGSSSSSGQYAIPCDSNVEVTMTFGGKAYSINTADMKNGAVDSRGEYCLGGILGASLGASAPAFIVGDVFLKNVFSVYDYEKKAVGFASLKGDAAQTASTTSGVVGSSGSATASATASTSASSDDGGNQPPILSTVSGADTSGINAGSGLPTPSASSSFSSQSVSLTPASGDASAGSASNGALIDLSAPLLTCLAAMGMGVALTL